MLDLGTLQELGVKLAGRLIGAEGHRIDLDDSLEETTGDAQRRLDRLLLRIEATLPSGDAAPADPPSPFNLHAPACRLDLTSSGIGTVIWATGYRPSYPWLRVPLLDEWGEIRQEGGVTTVAGLYALGLRHMRRRSSSFIRGCGRDAEELAPHIIAGLEARPGNRHSVDACLDEDGSAAAGALGPRREPHRCRLARGEPWPSARAQRACPISKPSRR